MNRDDPTETLAKRLPELDWKFSQLPYAMVLWNLPRGLFQTPVGKKYTHYLAEIDSDIQLLQQDRGMVGQMYLARKIEQKINVLVRLWFLQQKKHKQGGVTTPVLQQLAKRRDWLQELEHSIRRLERQLNSLERQGMQDKRRHEAKWHLQLEHDIGKARQQLTLLQEQYQRASSANSKDSRP